MIPMSLSQVARVVGGTVHGVAEPDAQALLVDGPVVTDSREAASGGLYVARVGEHADGHDFAAAALAAGCVAALTTRPLEGLACVVVEDTQAAFAALARAVVDASPGLTVVGLTGSSGKTSTKDLLGEVLATVGPTVAPVGSYNSEVGVPLTVCRVEPDTRFLVVEMGARGPGHIAYLTGMAPPRIGVVLNVGTAHLGEFGSREAIARAKSELPAALPEGGLAVLNADDPAVRAMAAVTPARVTLVGEAEDAEVRAREVALDAAGRPSFRLETASGATDVALGLVGRHHVGNALAVAAVALEVGLSLDEVGGALSTARPRSRWRMEVTERPDGVTVVNDAYNANPDSMRAALATLERMGEGRRTWAVLGTMLELGTESAALHAAVGAEAVARGVEELLVVGQEARPLATGAIEAAGGTNVRHVPDAETAERLLRAELAPGDVALFKSSRDAGLRLLGDTLATTPEEQHP
ncbi:UDP-N-acetylmuramoyl-tripeptide--D-alanyl-D-alanine ligase [Phycicoccus endophyticus]|uniref:UDP-N-acetylmuramoyl-tripeptide--D-alanyl-D-alanine ligase n=1 Tax=Phycicoccus endophyticus TaxID=1690220 RepID=A0A7G9R549_9MICO|nr:UDP-N-acetylmuramoyl-tripeptide--D-alanyl-D-alanine ligase [Phycicoccus endophyticus]NHI20913.1 UDP-N-acetylmuramoyl-tripeptide--D-alanyl-D-alanine ligase [Phycicoccus endophyticus]QNN50724.1 UDP-N-acetylmuramoyl-tripeptide--D-alanyl-D-alanine ligase [Phycicoccus endophyticus]GGL22000.1 UDP-N-acetylmuramoyl-tripeptide--D-alanyl-D-alanine ligase [Phycicoccus endophyticus]